MKGNVKFNFTKVTVLLAVALLLELFSCITSRILHTIHIPSIFGLSPSSIFFIIACGILTIYFALFIKANKAKFLFTLAFIVWTAYGVYSIFGNVSSLISGEVYIKFLIKYLIKNVIRCILYVLFVLYGFGVIKRKAVIIPAAVILLLDNLWYWFEPFFNGYHMSLLEWIDTFAGSTASVIFSIAILLFLIPTKKQIRKETEEQLRILKAQFENQEITEEEYQSHRRELIAKL